MNTLSSPNALRASFCAARNASENSVSVCTTRMPFPPPPALALIKTGKPTFFATSNAASVSVIASLIPGTSGTPYFSTACLLAILLPIISMASAVGPIKTIPFSANFRANTEFSDKNP